MYLYVTALLTRCSNKYNLPFQRVLYKKSHLIFKRPHPSLNSLWLNEAKMLKLSPSCWQKSRWTHCHAPYLGDSTTSPFWGPPFSKLVPKFEITFLFRRFCFCRRTSWRQCMYCVLKLFNWWAGTCLIQYQYTYIYIYQMVITLALQVKGLGFEYRCRFAWLC